MAPPTAQSTAGEALLYLKLELAVSALPCYETTMLTLRNKPFIKADHFEVYSGEIRLGAIYRSSRKPEEGEWTWFLDGLENAPGYLNGFARTFEAAKAEFAAAWRDWLRAAGLTEDTPTEHFKEQAAE